MGFIKKIADFFDDYEVSNKINMFNGLPNTVPEMFKDYFNHYDRISIEDIKKSIGVTNDEDAKMFLCLDGLVVNRFVDINDSKLIKMIIRKRYKYSKASAEKVYDVFRDYFESKDSW